MLERSQQFRWMRPNAHLFIRQDAHRFMAPGATWHIGRDVVKYFEPFRRDGRGLETRERKYSPNQPRIPAGGPGGGRWTSGGGFASGHSEGGALGGDQIAVGESDTFSFGLGATSFDADGWETVATDFSSDGLLTRELAINKLDGTKILSEVATSGDERHFVLSPNGDGATFQNSGDTQSIFVDGQKISEVAWTGNGLEPQAFAQPAFFDSRSAIVQGWALYTWMSSRNGPDSTAVFAFNAREFVPGIDAEAPAIFVKQLTEDQVRDVCPRLPDVQSLTNESATILDRGAYRTAAEYGTAVHMRVKELINGPDTTPSSPPRDPNFRAEVSVLKSLAADYGDKGSKRIDVLENPGTGTVCVYDIKTGNSIILPGRAKELAQVVNTFYPGTTRIIVTEVKPRQ